MDYKKKIASLPEGPGVYMMKDALGEILYVGKASNLRKRVSSYFHAGKASASGKTRIMVGKIEDIAYIPTASEAEALIYENGLIKKLSPRYNVALKDGKSYPMLKLTVQERFARLELTRVKKDDGALYFGPYTSAKLLKEALVLLNKIFPLRKCAKIGKRSCLNLQIGQCLGPCEERIGEEKYAQIVEELRLFLEGRKDELVGLLTVRMSEESARQNFEEASRIKKQIEALISVKQDRVRYAPGGELKELKDIIGSDKEIRSIEAFDISDIMGKLAVGSMIFFQNGRPRRNEYKRFRIEDISGMDDYAMMRQIVRRRYSRLVAENLPLPDLILIDGGKGHLFAAIDEVKKLGLAVPVMSVAKEFENIFIEGRKEPIILPRESKLLHLVKRIRDEAHRFAIAYHKKLRSREARRSELDSIEGIGGKRKAALLKAFGSVERIKDANLEAIAKVKGMNERASKNVIAHFRK